MAFRKLSHSQFLFDPDTVRSDLYFAEFEQMVSTLYAKAGVAELVKERNEVMDEIRAVSDQLNDHNVHFIQMGILFSLI